MRGSAWHLVPDLEYRHHARQVTRLATGAAERGESTRVLSLAGSGPLSPELPAGVVVPVRRRRGFLPPSGWPELAEWLRGDPPEVLHVWGRSALWAWSAAGTVSRCRPTWSFSPLVGETLTRVERGLLVGCSEVVVPHINYPGFSPAETTVLPPLSAPLTTADASGDHPGVPREARVILAVGCMDQFSAFRDTLWAFDILSRGDRMLHLVLIGDGPARRRLERFAGRSGCGAVHFIGPAADPEAWLRRAALVWLPDDAGGGLHRLTETLVADRPVIVPKRHRYAQYISALHRVETYEPGSGVGLAEASAPHLVNGENRNCSRR